MGKVWESPCTPVVLLEVRSQTVNPWWDEILEFEALALAAHWGFLAISESYYTIQLF